MPSWLPIEEWRDVLDISLVAVFLWLAIRYFRRTRARAALVGLALLGVIYFAARGLDLRLTAALFQGFFAVLVLILVVVFQDELRRVFEQIGSWRRGHAQVSPESESLDVLVRTVSRLAATRTGALFVLPGQEPLERHLDGGIELGGRISEPLLLSLFDASSPGHDGAVLLRGSRVERFAIHLPLSSNHEALGPGGTRHAAGLGISERCDATAIIVSEERGTISLAREGELRVLSRAEDLIRELGPTFQGEAHARPWWRDRAGLDAALAIVGALVLWVVLVPGSNLSQATLDAHIEVTNLPSELALEATEPETIEVTVRGLRRDVLLARQTGVTVRIDAYLARLGRRTFSVSAQNVVKPDALSIESVTPDKVKLSLANAPKAEAPPD